MKRIKKTPIANFSMPKFTGSFLSNFMMDLAIDFGTANTRIHVKNKGIVLNEPTVISRQERGGHVVAVGVPAEEMLGRAPKNIITARPLDHGVISDFDMAQALLAHFFRNLQKQPGRFPFPLFPRVLIGIPAGVTEVERKAVVDAGLGAGARKVFLVEEPMAAAVGSALPINEARASLILDIGAGTSEVAVVSWGGVVVSRSSNTAGDEMNETIVNWIREKHNVLVGEQSAEILKKQLNLIQKEENTPLAIRGRNLTSGLPKELTVDRDELRQALQRPINQITELVRDIIEETPPELVADMVQSGLTLSGGGAQLGGLDHHLAESLEVPVRVAEAPELSVIKGLARILEQPKFLEKVQVAWSR